MTALPAAGVLRGSGATFPYPLYVKLFETYRRTHGVTVKYGPVGSGRGLENLRTRASVFAASEVPLTDREMRKFGRTLLHVPVCIGAVAVSCNLGDSIDLRLTPHIIAGIYMGTITRWNDRRIKAVNPGMTLPRLDIIALSRLDASGTTWLFTDFLSRTSKDWFLKIGTGTRIQWPCGLSADGNSGVATFVKQIPGSIAYVQLAHTEQLALPRAAIQNKKGAFLKPTASSIQNAVRISVPSDTRISMTDTRHPQGYPIVGFSWIIVDRTLEGLERREDARALAAFLWWMTHEGQEHIGPFPYVRLPEHVVRYAEKMIRSFTWNGERVYP